MENMENNTIESTVIDEDNNVTTTQEYVDNDGNYYDYEGHYDLTNQNSNEINSGINPVVAAGAAGAIIGVIALAKNAGKIKKAILTKLNEGSQKALDKIAEKEAAKEAEKADKEAAETKAEEK